MITVPLIISVREQGNAFWRYNKLHTIIHDMIDQIDHDDNENIFLEKCTGTPPMKLISQLYQVGQRRECNTAAENDLF